MESVLFVSRSCRYSMQLMQQFPRIPSSISVVDVHDPRARRYLAAYNIKFVPSLLVVETRSGKYSVVSNRTEVARVIVQLSGGALALSGPTGNGQQHPTPQQQKQQQMKQAMDEYKSREGVDAQGPFPQDSADGEGLCGFDGNCSSELVDIGETYQAPSAKTNSMEAQLIATSGPDQRPQFQPPIPPQRPLLAATQSGNAPQIKSGSSLSDQEMQNKLEELAKARETYDKNIEMKNRQMNTLSMTMRN